MTSTVNRSLQSLQSTQNCETSKLKGVGGLSDLKVLQALNAAVIITDVAGLVTHWNPFAEKLYGWTAEEVVGQSIMGITVATETAGEAARHMAQLQAGKSWAGEFGVRCKDGKFLPALVTPFTAPR
jgi:PAS domain S-box-containing protein